MPGTESLVDLERFLTLVGALLTIAIMWAAIAILGWPIQTLPAAMARQVVDGGRQTCREAGILLAGGHSIDAPEPMFGLAVTGQVDKTRLKQNNTASAGCLLYLTKPLGIGILIAVGMMVFSVATSEVAVNPV